MYCLVFAFLKEARPFIEKLGLTLEHHEPYPIYSNDEFHLVLSGPGSLNAASAVNRLKHTVSSIYKPIWLNIGLAGHPSADLGTLLCASKIENEKGENSFYPQFILEHSIPMATLKTLDQPSSNYKAATLYDMEGYGFYFAASRYATVEQIHCLKVISDNQQQPFDCLNLKTAPLSISKHVETILDFCFSLKALNSEQTKALPDSFLDQFRFTHTQKNWLEKHLFLLQKSSENLFEEFKEIKHSKELIKALEQKLRRIPL